MKGLSHLPASVGTIARREYVTRVRSRTFVVMTLLVPLFLVGSMLVPVFLQKHGRESARRIAIADSTGVLADSVRAALESTRSADETKPQIALVDADSAGIADAQQLVRMGAYDALVIIPSNVFAGGAVSYDVKGAPNFADVQRIRHAVTDQVVALRLWRQGIDADRVEKLLTGVNVRPVRLAEKGGEVSGEDMTWSLVAGLLMGMLMYFSIILYGNWTLQGVLRDKTSRIVEILLATVRPTELMLGKIGGIGAVGLTQIGIWLAVVVGAGYAWPNSVVGKYLAGIDAISFVAFVLFYVAGFLLFATLYAAVGAVCSSSEDAQQLQMPVSLLLIVPVFLASTAVMDPGRPLIVALSFVPWFSPVLMLLRLAAGQAHVIEGVAALVLDFATILGSAWVAGRLFRVGILMMGKRPSLREIWRWAREG